MEVKKIKSAFSVFNSVCVRDMMINNRGTSLIRRPPRSFASLPPPPHTALQWAPPGPRPGGERQSVFIWTVLSSDDTYLNMERQRRKPSGSQHRKRRIGKEKGCAGMKKSFQSVWKTVVFMSVYQEEACKYSGWLNLLVKQQATVVLQYHGS